MIMTSKNAVQLIEVVTNLLEDAGNKEKIVFRSRTGRFKICLAVNKELPEYFSCTF